MVKVEVDPGVCGLKTILSISKVDKKTLKVEIESDCPHVKAMESDLSEINSMKECFGKYSSSIVYQSGEKHIKHLACPVPTAIIKGMEIESGFAAAKDVCFRFEKKSTV